MKRPDPGHLIAAVIVAVILAVVFGPILLHW